MTHDEMTVKRALFIERLENSAGRLLTENESLLVKMSFNEGWLLASKEFLSIFSKELK